MAQCFYTNSNGRMILDQVPIDQCVDYIVLEASEFSDYPTLSAIFNQPISSDLATMWSLGFSLPMIVYLSSWAFGQVVSYINK